ncbi:MAG: ThiF family adenylyltransferase [Synergistaceae bacterium]|nr:ThiF family adenylyltransferase [Synergistaceae bacterium]
MREVLNEVDKRIDVDTVIDVHTHPFSKSGAWFSGVDDSDEEKFSQYLHEKAPEIHYASIVFSQNNYQARYWEAKGKNKSVHHAAFIRTQKISEAIPSSDDVDSDKSPNYDINEMFNRSVLALGLDKMRAITSGQEISVIGVGGIGSIIAEHLVHMGFSKINLIDPDTLELTNLNRIEGVTYEDAEAKRLKVEVIAKHLKEINPHAEINAYSNNVFDPEVEEVIARSDWLMVATDNHASRFKIQELAFKYYVPFITAGVNITVQNGVISDMSGEVILIRIGDKVCLTCLRRLKYNEIAKEIHPDKRVREGLVAKGYVTGKNVKEPAVKTLNSHLATMAVDVLINQYTERDRDAIILVYEDNGFPVIYEDKISVENRDLHCSICDI